MKITIAVTILLLGALLGRFVWLGHKSRNMELTSSLKGADVAVCESPDHCFDHKLLKSESPDLWEKMKSQESLDLNTIEKVLKEDGLEKVSEDEDYLHYIATSDLFGFVDDVEILMKEGSLQFKSSSRVGKSDLGANKKRMMSILRKIVKTQPSI